MKQFGGNIHCNLFSSVFVKFTLCFLLLAITYCLFSPNLSPPNLSISQNDPNLSILPRPPPQFSVSQGCNLFIGEWIPDSNGPVYTNSTCPEIASAQNCLKNGKPNSDYLYWRWNPRDCSLPKLDPHKFLEMMRDKTLAFIGDSIMRNHAQSLLCILSREEQAVQVYHDDKYKNQQYTFPFHRFNISLIWSPLLTKAFIFEDDWGVPSGITRLHLDEPDALWTEKFETFDYVVIAGGKWFLKPAVYYENKTIVGCHNCHSNITEIDVGDAYRKALNSTLKFIVGSKHKAHVLFRTTTPDHFENGEWDTGGYCNRTGPYEAEEAELHDIDRLMTRIEHEEYKAAAAAVMGNGRLELFDTTMLSLMRPDGHPGVYMKFNPYDGKEKGANIQNDCLHWCLPGPIDAWCDLMVEMLVRSTQA